MTTASDAFWRVSPEEDRQVRLNLLLFFIQIPFLIHSENSFPWFKYITSFGISVIQVPLLTISENENLNFVDWLKCLMQLVTLIITFRYLIKIVFRYLPTLSRNRAPDQTSEAHPAVQSLGAK